VGDARPLLGEGDDSLRAHSCHGRARQVEVVREAVLHLLAADATLEPRDVIIMCPDIELFAPLVQASFGAASLAGAPELRARLADRSLRQTNPLLAVSAHLLEIAEGQGDCCPGPRLRVTWAG
jgi:exodeoxyribonuclease V gamma subunit